MRPQVPSSVQPDCDVKCADSPHRVTAAEMRSMSPRVRDALIALKTALAQDPGIMHVQVTFDDVGVRDNPPTLDVIPSWYHWEPGQTRPPAHVAPAEPVASDDLDW